MGSQVVPADDLPNAAVVPHDDLPDAYQPPSAAAIARTAGPLGRKRAESAREVLRQQDPGVDYSGVNDSGNRAIYSLLSTPEEKTAFLKSKYGPDKVSTDSFGRHVIQMGDKPMAFLPRGTDSSWADLAGEVAPVGGMVAGAIAGAPLGVGGSIVGSGLGAAGGEAINQNIKNFLGYRQQDSTDIAKDIVTQVPKGMAAEALGQGAMLLGRTALAPYAERSLLGPNREAIPAYREQMKGVDEARDMGLTPRVGTFAPGAGFVQRAQNAGARLFGDPIALRNRPVIEAGRQDLLGQVGAGGEVSPTALNATGEAASQKIVGRAENVIQAAQTNADKSMIEANAILKQAQDKITASVGQPSGTLATSAAQDITAAKEAFSKKASELYAPVDDLMGKPVVPTAGLKKAMQAILESLPQKAEGGAALTSEATRAFANGVNSLADFTTFQQMQNARILFRNKAAVDALNAGLSESQAARLAGAADAAFDAAANNVKKSFTPPPGGVEANRAATMFMTKDVERATQALRRADQFYAAGIKRFNDLSVEALVKDASQHGFVQPEKVAQYIAAPGQTDKLLRIKKVVSPDTFAEVGKETWQRMTGAAEDSLTGEVSGKRLADRLTQMGRSLDVLYGPMQAEKMRNLARHLAALDGKIDTAALKQSGNMVSAIEDAVAAQSQFKKLVGSNYLGLIREGGDKSLKAADWLTQPANRMQLRNTIQTFGENSPEAQSLKEYLARKIMLSMEVQAHATEEKYGSTVLMGDPLKKELAMYGRPYLEEVFGKEWSDKVHKFADTVEVGTRRNPSDSGGLAAASIGLKWLHHLTDLAKYYSVGWATAKSPTITYMTKGTPGFQDNSAIMEKLRGLSANGTRAYIGTQTEEVPKNSADYARAIQEHALSQ